MKIYVPIYLRELPIIKNFCDIYEAYIGGGYYISPKDSMDDYRESLKRDPVKYFVNFCLADKEEELGEEEYKNMINYISKMFEAVKGTKRVFDFMKKYLDDFLHIEGDPVYTGQYIEIMFGPIELTDVEQFYTSLLNFLGALLFFEELKTNIGQIGLTVKDEITNYVAGDTVCYKKFDVIYEPDNQ